MEGLSRRSVPPVVRSFAPSRLTDDLLYGVYERLLKRSPPGETDADWEGRMEQESQETLPTGGRS